MSPDTKQEVLDAIHARDMEIQRLRRELDTLTKEIERCAPYVLATLPMDGNVDRSSVKTDDPQWTAIHKARGVNSYRMIKSLQATANWIAPTIGVIVPHE